MKRARDTEVKKKILLNRVAVGKEIYHDDKETEKRRKENKIGSEIRRQGKSKAGIKKTMLKAETKEKA